MDLFLAHVREEDLAQFSFGIRGAHVFSSLFLSALQGPVRGSLLLHHVVPLLVRLFEYVQHESFVQQFSTKSELRLRLAVRHLVVANKFEDLLSLAREHLVDVRGIVQLVSVLVSDVNGDELPVHFTLVDHSVATEHFSLHDSSCSMQLGANIASVHGIVVTYVDILRKYAAPNI
jgi:hypothetical protein